MTEDEYEEQLAGMARGDEDEHRESLEGEDRAIMGDDWPGTRTCPAGRYYIHVPGRFCPACGVTP